MLIGMSTDKLDLMRNLAKYEEDLLTNSYRGSRIYGRVADRNKSDFSSERLQPES